MLGLSFSDIYSLQAAIWADGLKCREGAHVQVKKLITNVPHPQAKNESEQKKM
jgi:hypothetical protein